MNKKLIMAEEQSEVLLKSRFYENCPGCRVDQRKLLQHGLPISLLASMMIVVIAAVLPVSSLFPYLYFMIRDFHVAESEEDIGYYAGYVGSAFMLGRASTAVLWGIVADRYGRKPVMIISIITVVIFNTLFGLSVNFWMAIITRFLLGSLNGLLGPIKAYAVEILRDEYQTLGLSIISTSWGVGLIIGPAIGGYLAQPAEKYPHIFSQDSVFGRFPYFLPSFLISIFAAGATIVSIWLPETLHMHGKNDAKSCDPFEEISYNSSSNDISGDNEGRGTTSKLSLLKNWPLMSSIIIYCVFSLHDMAYSEIFSLWVVSPRKDGGLSYSTDDVGNILAASGLSLLVFQIFLYPYAEKLLGPILLSRAASIISIPLLQSYTFITMLSGFTLIFMINLASIIKNVLSVSIITSLFILQNSAVEQHQRGAANGLAMTLQSICKSIGPAGGGSLFSWAEKRQDASFLPGTQLVFFTLNVIEAIGVMMTFKPFLTRRQS